MKDSTVYRSEPRCGEVTVAADEVSAAGGLGGTSAGEHGRTQPQS